MKVAALLFHLLPRCKVTQNTKIQLLDEPLPHLELGFF